MNRFDSVSDLSDDDDLPPLPNFISARSSKPKSIKSQEQLMNEHENLAKDIKIDNISNDNIKEKMKRLEVEQVDEIEDMSLSPVPVVNEDIIDKIFCVNDTLQYFTIGITPVSCGYDSKSEDLTAYERKMLSFRRVELETVLATFLLSSNIGCISDCKSFVTFLLRNISVHSDVASIQACYNSLLMMLLRHPSGKSLRFSSAEIFMLLFNYGTNIDSFKFLSKRPDIRGYLEEPRPKNISYSKIPENWMFNFKFVLNAVINIINHCEIEIEDLCNIIIYFMWMSLDSSLFQGNIFFMVRECICTSLDRVPKDKWPSVMVEVARTFMSVEFSSVRKKWSNIHRMLASVPANTERGLEFRKYISILVLRCTTKVELSERSSEEKISADVIRTLNRFSLSEFQSLIQSLVEMDSELISLAAKFLDICMSNLNASDQDFKELCYILKQCESALSERAHEAKAHILKIHARLKIRLGKNVMYKVHSEDAKRIHIAAKEKETLPLKVVSKDKERAHMAVKKEPDQDMDIENVPNPFHHIKVKEEPVQEPVPNVAVHNAEKIISFSEFDYEDDDEDLDLTTGKLPDIHMDVVPVKTERTIDSDSRNSLENGNSIIDMPPLLPCSVCDVSGQEYVDSSKFSAKPVGENICISAENSVICNPPVLEAIIPLIEDSRLADEFAKDGTRFSFNHGLIADTINDLSCKDVSIDKTTFSYLDVPVTKSATSCVDETSSYERPSAVSVSRFENDLSCEDVLTDKTALSYMDVPVIKSAVSCVDETSSRERPIADAMSRFENDLPCEDGSIDKTAVLSTDVSVDKSASSYMDTLVDRLRALHADISAIESTTSYENILVEKPSKPDASVDDSTLSVDKSIACVVDVLTPQELESHVPLENNDLGRKPSTSPEKKGTENSVMFHQSNIAGISGIDEAVYPENIVNQSKPIDLLDNNTSDISNALTADVFGESMKDVTSADSIVDNSSFPEEDNCPSNIEFSSEVDNHSDPLTKLVKSLALPEGTEILPIKTIIDSTVDRELSKPFVQSADVNCNIIKKTVIDEEVMFIQEVKETISPSKTKKSQNKKSNNTVETIESDGSDKELQIVFVKPVEFSSKSENNSKNSHKDKPKYSENKSKCVEVLIDEEITFVTEVNLDINKTKSNLMRSKSSESKDSKVCNRQGVIVSPKIDSAGGVELSNKTKVSKFTDITISGNISDDDGIVFIGHVDSPLKNKPSDFQYNETVKKEDEIKGIERVGSPLTKSIKSENMISYVSDINLCKGSSTIDSTVTSSDSSVSAENGQILNQDSDVFSECLESVKSNTELVDGEVVATMNEAILEKFTDLENYLKSPFVEEQEFGKSTSSVDQASADTDAVIGNGNMQKEDSSKLHSEKDDKIDTEENLSKKGGQSVVKTKLLKKKCTNDNIENKVLETAFINSEVINTDVIGVVDNLLALVSSSRDDVDRSVYSVVPHCTKSLPNNVPEFNLLLNPPKSSVECPSPINEFISSSPAHHLSEKSNLETVDVLQEALNSQAEEENLIIECSQSSETKSVIGKCSKGLINYMRLNALLNSVRKNISRESVLLESNQKKSMQIKPQLLPRLSERNVHSFPKRKNEFSSPSSKVQKHSMNSFADDGARGFSDHSNFDENITSTSPLKFSPKKSFLSTNSFNTKKSPNSYFDYMQKRNNYCAFKNAKKKDVLSRTGDALRAKCTLSSSNQPEHYSTSSKPEIYDNRSGLKYANILREQLMSSSSNQPEKNSSTSSKTEVYVSSDSDSDIQELYVDPKRYADSECMVVFESEDQIVID